jgi:hypothetical protein
MVSEMKVVIASAAIDYLEKLTYVLFKKGYFGFYESACEYVDRIFDFIYYELPHKSKKIAPKYFSKFGKNMYYVTYHPNKRTTWYIFFNWKDERYLIRYITNSHVSAQHIRGLK